MALFDWTPEQLAILERRGQPPLTWGPKTDDLTLAELEVLRTMFRENAPVVNSTRAPGGGRYRGSWKAMIAAYAAEHNIEL